MNRREWLRTAAAAGSARALHAAAPRRNIVVLYSDDQRFDTIRALGNNEIRTPNLDRLVRNGTTFTHTYVMGGMMGAICVPSRAMLMAGQGLHHVHASIIQPDKSPENAKRPFNLFPEELRKAGYHTHGIGKWHNGPRLFARCFSGGDNIFFGGMGDQNAMPVQDFDPSGEYPKSRIRPSGKNATDLFADSAVKFIREYRGEKPFLLYTAFTSPHDPRTAPKRFHDLYSPDKVRLPANFMAQHPFDNGELKVRDELLASFPRTPEEIRRHIADYYAMITHLDAQVGRIIDAVEQSGRARDTLIVFAGDNGLAVGQHGLMGKQNVYEHSVRVPLVVSGPGFEQGRKREDFRYNMDICPTVLEAAGVEVPRSVEGRSLSKPSGRDSMYFAYRNFQRAVRTRDWKLIRYTVDGKETIQLFHISEDPHELKNIADKYPDRVRELTALLADWMKKTDDPLLPAV
jgi:arylsulfatase A-like enzyme